MCSHYVYDYFSKNLLQLIIHALSLNKIGNDSFDPTK